VTPLKENAKTAIAEKLDAIDKTEEKPVVNVPPVNETPLRPESRRDMRSLAFHFLYAVDRLDYTIPLEEIISTFKAGYNLDLEEDSLAETMAKGAIENREELDEQIKPLLRNWRLERLGCCTHLILRLALWELKQPDAIPNIVINEAIELAKSFAEKDSYKFINGILDEACKVLFPNQEFKEKGKEKSHEQTTNDRAA